MILIRGGLVFDGSGSEGSRADIAIRDGVSTEAAEQRVNELLGDMAHPEADAEKGKQTYAALNQVYQTISRIRKDLERTLKQITADTEAAQKRFDESNADLDRLKTLLDRTLDAWGAATESADALGAGR